MHKHTSCFHLSPPQSSHSSHGKTIRAGAQQRRNSRRSLRRPQAQDVFHSVVPLVTDSSTAVREERKGETIVTNMEENILKSRIRELGGSKGHNKPSWSLCNLDSGIPSCPFVGSVTDQKPFSYLQQLLKYLLYNKSLEEIHLFFIVLIHFLLF